MKFLGYIFIRNAFIFNLMGGNILQSDIILAISFTLAFISLVALIFTDKKILFGIITLLLFVFFYRSKILEGDANLYTILAFVSGVLLLSLELFIPSFGIIGVVGIILTVYSLFDSFDNNKFSFLVLLSTAAAVIISVTIFVKLGFSAKIFDKAILNNTLSKERGFNSKKDYRQYLGKIAITKTILRPTGTILVEKIPLDAKTDGEFIKKDRKVLIKAIKDGHIIVEEIKEDWLCHLLVGWLYQF